MDGFSNGFGQIVGPISFALLSLLIAQLVFAYRLPTWHTALATALDDELGRRGVPAILELTEAQRVAVDAMRRDHSTLGVGAAEATAQFIARNTRLTTSDLEDRRTDATAAALDLVRSRSARIRHLDVLVRCWPALTFLAGAYVAVVATKDLGRQVAESIFHRFSRRLGHVSATAAVVAVIAWPSVYRSDASAVLTWQAFVGAMLNLAVGLAVLWTLADQVRTLLPPSRPRTRHDRFALGLGLALAGAVAVTAQTGHLELVIRLVNVMIASWFEQLDDTTVAAIGLVGIVAFLVWRSRAHILRCATQRDLVARADAIALAAFGTSMAVTFTAAMLRLPMPVLTGAGIVMVLAMCATVALSVTQRLLTYRRWRATISTYGGSSTPSMGARVVWCLAPLCPIIAISASAAGTALQHAAGALPLTLVLAVTMALSMLAWVPLMVASVVLAIRHWQRMRATVEDIARRHGSMAWTESATARAVADDRQDRDGARLGATERSSS